MDSSMCSSVHDLEMWIIQGTLAWRILLAQPGWGDSVRSNVDPTFDSLRGIRRPGTTTASLLENPYIPYRCMDSYLGTCLGSASIGK
ncbi:hypothetical protein H5410_027510 [Solanum commersonii]|uniref:Uncharacterized protein n=1 Tax=Solanum commersonii TaxID=4109 RepID=A0A9J5Z021_SOLCO|nr:hypothetical protein H5410_027510 [Solanum commersonii]